MINSMTGFGEAHGEINGILYTVEIKSLNNRYLKTSVKLPETVVFLEEPIEKLLRESVGRGTVNYTLKLKNIATEPLFDLDEATLRRCVERLNNIAGTVSLNCSIDISGLLMLPGILQPAQPEPETAGNIKKHVLKISCDAVEKLKKMRAVEGAAIASDLRTHCLAITHCIDAIRGQVPSVLKRYHCRLKKRVEELLADAKIKINEETLAREVAVFADRSDIAEELARLESHLQQLEQAIANENQVGRQLDFIGQELLREANTIASKASDSEIIHMVVEVKCLIERIKEQVQNVE